MDSKDKPLFEKDHPDVMWDGEGFHDYLIRLDDVNAAFSAWVKEQHLACPACGTDWFLSEPVRYSMDLLEANDKLLAERDRLKAEIVNIRRTYDEIFQDKHQAVMDANIARMKATEQSQSLRSLLARARGYVDRDRCHCLAAEYYPEAEKAAQFLKEIDAVLKGQE